MSQREVHSFRHSLLFGILLFYTMCVSGNGNNIISFNETLDSNWSTSVTLDSLVPIDKEVPIAWIPDSKEYKVPFYSLGTGYLQCAGYYNKTMTVYGPGKLTFWWKKTDYLDETYTRLYVKVDNKIFAKYNNKSYGWDFTAIEIPLGKKNVTWIFQIDKSLGGTVCWPLQKAQGWIDEVSFIPTNRSLPTVEPVRTRCQNDSRVINSENSTCEGSLSTASVSYKENDIYSWNIAGGDILSGTGTNRINWMAGDSEFAILSVNITQRDIAGNCSKDIKKEIKIIHKDNSIIELSPRNDLNLTEEINKCKNCSAIYLNNGTYFGPLVILKKDIKIKSKYKFGSIINGGPASRCILVRNTSNVHIENLSIFTNSGGFKLINSSYCIVDNNKISYGAINGLCINKGINNSIINNTFLPLIESSDEFVDGIMLFNSNNSTIYDNLFIEPRPYEINCIYNLSSSYHNTIYYKNSGRIYSNGLVCESNDSSTYCDYGQPINASGNLWERL